MKTKKGKIFHMEDNPEWVNIIEDVLGDDYEIYSASEWLEAANEFASSRQSEKTQFDLAIIDIGIKIEKGYGDKAYDETGGLGFIENLIDTYGELIGNRIIILSGQQRDASWISEHPIGKREYKVLAVFDKSAFVDEIDRFKNLIDKTVASASGE